MQQVRAQKGDILTQLEQCVKAKEELEERLYVKFAQVLNSKKKKIRTLAGSIEKQGVVSFCISLSLEVWSSGCPTSIFFLSFVFVCIGALATVQIGTKLYQYGNGITEVPRSAESSPKKPRLSPKKVIHRAGSSFDGLDKERPQQAGSKEGSEEPKGDPDAPRKPKNLLGSPEDPPPLLIKRKRRPMNEHDDYVHQHRLDFGDGAEKGSGSVSPEKQPPRQQAPTAPVPRLTRGSSREGGVTSQQPQQQADFSGGDPSPARRTQKRQKSDPSYSVSDLINNI